MCILNLNEIIASIIKILLFQTNKWPDTFNWNDRKKPIYKFDLGFKIIIIKFKSYKKFILGSRTVLWFPVK